MSNERYSPTLIERTSLLHIFQYNMVRACLHDRPYFIIAWVTITESTIFEASQENWDTFMDNVCLRDISVYYLKVSQVFARCVNEKVVRP